MARLMAAIAVAALAVAIPAGTAQAAAKPVKYKNCAALTKAYRHGVGKPGAQDKVSTKGKPVTTFAVDAQLYTVNKGLDRDGDGIACEKL